METTQELLKALRGRGLTQVEIAKRSGIPQPRLSRWEAGEAPAAADDALRLRRLCEELAGVETVGDETAAPQPTATPEPTHAAG
jgi:transcriptional regulator with XRE-family HTH domain